MHHSTVRTRVQIVRAIDEVKDLFVAEGAIQDDEIFAEIEGYDDRSRQQFKLEARRGKGKRFRQLVVEVRSGNSLPPAATFFQLDELFVSMHRHREFIVRVSMQVEGVEVERDISFVRADLPTGD